MADEPKDRDQTRKEQAKQQRRAAYLRAKEWKANDPKSIAFKETMKLRQRAAYQVAKERNKVRNKQRKDARAAVEKAAPRKSPLFRRKPPSQDEPT